ncbi:MAG: B12-binding domain-containing radical SAM protein [Brotaphodocola sp.]
MKFLLTAINAKYIHSNPGVYSLKTFAEHQGGACPVGQDLPPVRVEIAEYTINNQMEQILEDIYVRKPDMIGISCYIWNVQYALDLARDIHKVLPDTDIWMGGPEVSFDAIDLLKREPEILGVMKGEGEETFASLLRAYGELGCTVRQASSLSAFWNSLSQIANLTWRMDTGEIEDMPLRPVMDMSRIPFLYPNLEGFENRIVYYESSRGCPFSCSYCLSSIDKSVRFRDLELVKKELDFFMKKNVPQVKFVDRTFNCRKSHAMEIWKYIFEHDNGVTNFHFEVAADLIDSEELELIRQMRPGLIQLEIGVQSTNPRTIAEIHRKMNLDEVRRVVAQINAGHNVHQHLDLIAGLPYEDYESFRQSFNDVYAMEPEQLQLGFLKVLKGSYMYEMAAQYDLVYRTLPPYEVLSTRWLPYSDVLRLKGIENMVEIYYNSRQYTQTLELLVKEFPDAFTMFERLAEYYQVHHHAGLNHSRLAKYEILHAFIQELLAEKEDKIPVYEDALVCDVYLRENSKSRPAFALDQAPYKSRIRELVPELRTLGTQIHVEALRSGEILLFDYRNRDPLTNNAMVESIDVGVKRSFDPCDTELLRALHSCNSQKHS